MRILTISYRIPYPLTAGFRIRIYNEAKYLKSMGHSVDLLFLGTQKDFDQYEDRLREVYDHVKLFRLRVPEIAANLVTMTLMQGKPTQVALYWNRQMDAYIRSVEDEYDVIIGNAVRNAEYLFKLPEQKAVLDFHDAISYNYENLIKQLSGPKKLFYQLERRLLVNYECAITEKLKKLIIISENDKAYMAKNGADVSSITVIPVAVRDDIRSIKADTANDEAAICFLGKLSYQPNADAVVWFAREVFPRLKEKYKELKFYVLGIEPPKEVRELEGDGIIVTGFVEDPFQIISRCMAMVVPIRNGAGMQNKILESMVVGTPCIISSIAEEGLNGTDRETYIVANTPDEYVHAAETLIESPATRAKISRQASEFVKRYTWDGIKNLFADLLESGNN